MIKLIIIFFCLIVNTAYLDVIDYNLELIHHIEFNNDSNNFGVSDVWGYTDETGIEYAIVGYRYGTMIYDVSSSDLPIEISNIIGPSSGDFYYHRDFKTYQDYCRVLYEMLVVRTNHGK